MLNPVTQISSFEVELKLVGAGNDFYGCRSVLNHTTSIIYTVANLKDNHVMFKINKTSGYPVGNLMSLSYTESFERIYSLILYKNKLY